MPRKPDRFERVVIERSKKDSGLWSDNVADLLRKEHRWVERMIQKNRTSIDNHRDAFDTAYVDGYMEACADFLNMLKQRRK